MRTRGLTSKNRTGLKLTGLGYLSNKQILDRKTKIAVAVGVLILCVFALVALAVGIWPPTAQSAASRYIPPSISKTVGCHVHSGLPDAACTPGATYSKVTQSNIHKTICVSGYTAKIRPSTSVTNPIKIKEMKAYGDKDSKSNYELDHLIPLELGGSPASVANLWPEPYKGTYGARVKDKVENYLKSQVCKGKMALAKAQKAIATNWKQFIKNTSKSSASSYDPDDGAPTALCKDGTYSYSATHSGTCSHHKGVKVWYK